MDSFKTKSKIKIKGKEYSFFRLKILEEKTGKDLSRLPFSIRILLENLLRNEDGENVKKDDIEVLMNWDPKQKKTRETSFSPARVLLQDFTGVPAIVDLAVMRDAMLAQGKDPKKINPLGPVDLVIDHSLEVSLFGDEKASEKNTEIEFERNKERYQFLKWGEQTFQSFRVVPPGTGIVHQVNLEYLAPLVFTHEQEKLLFPDTLVGTDSHTTMINGLGVLGWGVGGIEAEAVMLGQPISMLIPEVVGFKLKGKLSKGVTATDLVLTVTEILRRKGVVGKFVEFFGEGLDALSLADRATLANMAPEYGATVAFFPADEETLRYLKFTGRKKEHIELVSHYLKEQKLFREKSAPEPLFHDVLELDLSSVITSLAGPKRPHDRVTLKTIQESFQKSLPQNVSLQTGKKKTEIRHGDVVIAAITSCTNTSNPAVMLAAGLLAKKAVEKGLEVKPWVKTSLAPGSKVVMDYLKQSKLTSSLEKLKFHLVGFGCTTCIGNSGPLPGEVSQAITKHGLVVASILSGNRNFEGRIHSQVRANYLASPPLVVAYALAGTVNIDLEKEPIGKDKKGGDIYLRDLWPSEEEIKESLKNVQSKMFEKEYSQVFEGTKSWKEIKASKEKIFNWDEKSNYIKKPPFFENMSLTLEPLNDIKEARVLVMLGDSVTTDHISPAGAISKASPAGKYLAEKGIEPKDFNSYGSRRGNHEVMMRGTFANIRLKNLILSGKEGGLTKHFPEGKETTIFEAATEYQKEGKSLIVIAGKEYGSGSSRDWAAKGPALLGIRAILAESFERIHRSNLIGMGILPLEFIGSDTRESLGLQGDETFSIEGIASGLTPARGLYVKIKNSSGEKKIEVLCRIDTPIELEYYRHGGILKYVLRQLIKKDG